MTTPSTPRKAGPLLGTGVQTAWPFTFKVFSVADVAVTIADSDGVETELAYGVDFTIALNGNQETSPGGTVTYPLSGSPLPVGSVLAIAGALPYNQPLDLPSGGNFSPLAIENQLDRTTMQIQQLAEEIGRAARLPVTSAADADSLVADIVLLADNITPINTVATGIAAVNTVSADLLEPVSEINTVAVNIDNVNAVGSGISAVTTVAGIAANVTTVAGIAANVTAVAGVAADVATVAGVTADVTAVADNAADISLVADNITDVSNFADVYQGPHATGPALRNNGGALQSGDLYFNTTENALRAYSGTVWVAGTAGSVSVQNFSGDGVETEFTLTTAPSSENNTQVYIGGAYQQKDQYSVAGSLLTFTEAPPTGTDNIEVVTLSALALGETDAALVSFTPAGSIAATNVQAALVELDGDLTALAGTLGTAAGLDAGTDPLELVQLTADGKLPAVSAANLTNVPLPDTGTITPEMLTQKMTLATAVAASGAAIDFTGIPSWAKRITINFAGVSMSGTGNMSIRLGDSGGVEATGYGGSTSYIGTSNTSTSVQNSTGFDVFSNTASSVAHGSVTLSLLNASTNTWGAAGVLSWSNTPLTVFCSGSKGLSAVLDRVSIIASTAFDAGTINILFEG